MAVIADVSGEGSTRATGMRRLLILSPNWPPMSFPDLHRVRMSLPYLAEHGWAAHVLCIDPDHRPGVRDERLAATVPSIVPVERVRPWSERLAAPLRVSALAWRSLAPLARAGDRIITHDGIDLVFISTTLSELMVLGPYWQARHGVPYVLDWQDPWRNDYYGRPGAPLPPGGRLRFALASGVARLLEPLVLRRAAHVISVSPAYPEMLRARYPWLREKSLSVVPFGASERDFLAVEALGIRQSVFDPSDGRAHWVYAGRLGGDMALSVRALLGAIGRARVENPARFARVRLHFIGGHYQPGSQEPGMASLIARELGVGDLVDEHASRLPYLETLRCLRDADVLMIAGSDDPAYSASKLYNCLMAARPLLAVVHRQSLAARVLHEIGAPGCATFADGESPQQVAARMPTGWIARSIAASLTPSQCVLDAFSARTLTKQQCDRFEAALQ